MATANSRECTSLVQSISKLIKERLILLMKRMSKKAGNRITGGRTRGGEGEDGEEEGVAGGEGGGGGGGEGRQEQEQEERKRTNARMDSVSFGK